MSQRDAQTVMREADDLVAKIQRQIEDADEIFRSQGLDPEKVRSVIEAQAGDKEAAEARALFEQDLQDVEREVSEEAARASFAPPARSSAGKKPRLMV